MRRATGALSVMMARLMRSGSDCLDICSNSWTFWSHWVSRSRNPTSSAPKSACRMPLRVASTRPWVMGLNRCKSLLRASTPLLSCTVWTSLKADSSVNITSARNSFRAVDPSSGVMAENETSVSKGASAAAIIAG